MCRAAAFFVAGFCALAPCLAADNEAFHPASVTPIGAHSCAGFYPQAAMEAHQGGVTTLSFRIAATGAVGNVTISKSSGNADLDDAAKSCVRTWRYVPVTRDGKPVEAAWEADVEFRAVAAAPAPQPLPVLVEQDKHACLSYPFWAKRHQAEGNAVLKYNVTPEGAVTDINLSKSSGNSELDEAAMDCVKSMKFRPHSGGEASRPVTATVTWSYLEHGPSTVRWVYVGVDTQATEAIHRLNSDAAACLRGAAGHPEFASGFDRMTVLRVHYDNGEINAVSVILTSGNDALDRYGAACYKNETVDPQDAKTMRRGNGQFVVAWRQYVHP